MSTSRASRILSALAALLALAAAPGAGADGPITDPILPGVTVTLLDVAQAPVTSGGARPLARLNLLQPSPDGTGRLFVNDMRGQLYVLEDGVLLTDPFLDVSSVLGANFVSGGQQQGFSTFAFHPDYANPGTDGYGKLYTVTSEAVGSGVPDFLSPSGSATHDSVLSEWTVDPSDPYHIDTTSRRELLRVEAPSGDHPMGQVGFDPNATSGSAEYGKLYVSFGDGGGYVAALGDEIDPNRTAQNPTNPYGSILRIDPFGTSTTEHPTNGQYGIPTDNPFTGNTEGTLEEIYAYGFRNPHRFSWDTGGDGKMIISDIGQANVEEVNLGAPGGNFGWSEREGTFVVVHSDQSAWLPLPPDDGDFGFTYPVAQYDHDEGSAIVGGFVYHGGRIPELEGMYVFGDLVNGRIFYTDADALVDGIQSPIYELFLVFEGQEMTLLEVLDDDFRADLRFGIDDDGEIYVLTKRDGMIRTLPEPGAGVLLLAGVTGIGLARRLRGCATRRR